MVRLFVAVGLPESVRDRLALLAQGLPGARWVAPENLHLTLRFIGEVDGGQAADIDAALSAVRMPGFDIKLSGVGHFGDDRKPRSLWAGVDPCQDIRRLYDKVEKAVVRSGLPPEKRKFKPHVTLARFKAAPGAKLYDFQADHALFRTETFAVESFTLYSSFLASEGAIYTPEVDYALERSGVVP